MYVCSLVLIYFKNIYEVDDISFKSIVTITVFLSMFLTPFMLVLVLSIFLIVVFLYILCYLYHEFVSIYFCTFSLFYVYYCNVFLFYHRGIGSNLRQSQFTVENSIDMIRRNRITNLKQSYKIDNQYRSIACIRIILKNH